MFKTLLRLSKERSLYMESTKREKDENTSLLLSLSNNFSLKKEYSSKRYTSFDKDTQEEPEQPKEYDATTNPLRSTTKEFALTSHGRETDIVVLSSNGSSESKITKEGFTKTEDNSFPPPNITTFKMLASEDTGSMPTVTVPVERSIPSRRTTSLSFSTLIFTSK